MTPGTEQNVTDDREVIQSNVRRIVGFAALRQSARSVNKLICMY